MEIVEATSNNLASIELGKNIDFEWRGQPNVAIVIRYSEWIKFMYDYRKLLSQRDPDRTSRIFETEDLLKRCRYFYDDISWSVYSELAISSNTYRGATLLVPIFDIGVNVDTIDLLDAINEANTISDEDEERYLRNICYYVRRYNDINSISDHAYGIVDIPSLTAWNRVIFKWCMYLKSHAYNSVTKNITDIKNIALDRLEE